MRQVAVGLVVLALSSVQLLAQAAPAGQRSTAPRGGGARAAAPAAAPAYTPAKKSPDAGPVLVFETVKGTFEIETHESGKLVAKLVVS